MWNWWAESVVEQLNLSERGWIVTDLVLAILNEEREEQDGVVTEVDARSRRPEYLHDWLERTVDHDVLEHRVLTHVVGRLLNIDDHHQLVTYQDFE